MPKEIVLEHSYPVYIYTGSRSLCHYDGKIRCGRPIWRPCNGEVCHFLVVECPSIVGRNDIEISIIARRASDSDANACHFRKIDSFAPKTDSSFRRRSGRYSGKLRYIHARYCVGECSGSSGVRPSESAGSVAFLKIRGIQCRSDTVPAMSPCDLQCCTVGIIKLVEDLVVVNRDITKIIDDIPRISARVGIVQEFFVENARIVYCLYLELYVSEKYVIGVVDGIDISGKTFSPCQFSGCRGICKRFRESKFYVIGISGDSRDYSGFFIA